MMANRPLFGSLRAREGSKPRDAHAMRRKQLLYGLGGVVVIAIVAAVSVIVYVTPFGTDDHRAEFATSGQLRPGDEVRVAGIKVGDVDSVAVVGDHVEVKFTADSSVTMGAQTTADIRLSTAIGGHYLAITPKGSTRLGDNPIPREQTTTPYELTDVLTDSGQVVDKVDGTTARQTFAQVTQALRGRSDAAREIISDIEAVTTTLGDRDDDLDRAVQISEEYIGALNTGRAKLVGLLRLVGVLGYKVFAFRAEGVETVRSIAALFAFLEPPIDAFAGTIEPELQKVLGVVRTLGSNMGRVGTLLDQLTGIANQLGKALGLVVPGTTVDLSSKTVSAPSICIPTPDRRC